MTNRLAQESSPYLLQHAHNPVDWYPWGPEAFEKAAREHKPVLVSIGYSTCHWCHVMERESFENESVAAYMNEHFVNIKVDREERPDVDQVYMEACQIINGSGGWPLNCFLLPDKRPFFAGTYYPPVGMYNRPSWLQVLQNIRNTFHNKPEVVEDQAARLTDYIRHSDSRLIRTAAELQTAGNMFGPADLDDIFARLRDRFDSEAGGFGSAPKFPGTMSLHFLLGYHHHTGELTARDHVFLSLDKMCNGGIYDHLGGGFARYATDNAWLVPHFEKMLYDNALLVALLADAWKINRSDHYKEAIEQTLGFAARELGNPEGGYYAALDADSEGEEGRFYVWDKAEVEACLGDEAALFCDRYNITEEGNWEGKNILHCREPLTDFAAARNMDPVDLARRLNAARVRLLEQRSRRVRPGLDDKMLLGWNALMVSALARAFEALGESHYRDSALRTLHFLLDRFRQPAGEALFHTYKNGVARFDAFLEDYAFLIAACLDVYQITFDSRWVDSAVAFTCYVNRHFWDDTEKLFFFTPSGQADLPLRRKEIYDSATPSGNAVMVANLQRLYFLTGQAEYQARAESMLAAVKTAIVQYAPSFSLWAEGMLRQVHPPVEIAVVGPSAHETASRINTWPLPNKIIMAAAQPDPRFPLLAHPAEGSDTYIYICSNFACHAPVTDLRDVKVLVGLKE